MSIDKVKAVLAKARSEASPKLFKEALDMLETIKNQETDKEVVEAYRKKIATIRKEMEGFAPKKEQVPNKASEIDNRLMGAVVCEKPNVKWEDVAGLQRCKEALREAVILPLLYPNLFEGDRKPWKGTGKTYLAKACATEMKGGSFYSVSSSDLTSKYVGDTEKLIKGIFQLARNNKPSVIFIDELDSMMGDRSEGSEASKRAVTEFLVQMDGVGSNTQGVLVLGATNLPWVLDSAIMRRFQRRIYVDLPSQDAVAYLLQTLMKDTPHSLSKEDFAELAKSMDGYSGSDIANLVRDACFEQLRVATRAMAFKVHKDGNYYPCSPSDPHGESMMLRQVPAGKLRLHGTSYEDFVQARSRIKASVDSKGLQRYEKFTAETGQKS